MKRIDERIIKYARNVVAVVFWLIIILLCLIYRDEITVDNIVAFTPQNTFVAVFVMLALFAVKSVSVFIYCGLLYAASGILFPLPLAVLVNILGSVIMATIPFVIGRKAGTGLVTKLITRYPNLLSLVRLLLIPVILWLYIGKCPTAIVSRAYQSLLISE